MGDMSETFKPEEGDPDLMTIKDICERHDVSRTHLHKLRVQGVFPPPVIGPGSTRLRWKRADVATFFAANPKEPGKRTDLKGPGSEESEGG